MTHTIELSEKAYQLLLNRAQRLRTTPEDVLEQVLISDPLLLGEEHVLPPPHDPALALAAVERLTTLFADVARADLDTLLDDPMLALANADDGDLVL